MHAGSLLFRVHTCLWLQIISNIFARCLLSRTYIYDVVDNYYVYWVFVAQKNTWLWHVLSLACCPKGHVVVIVGNHYACRFLVAQEATWLWHVLSLTCCPERHVVVILLGNHRGRSLLVAQKNTWLWHACVCCLLSSRRTRGGFDTAGG
jgi:uncharacterized membrane protein YgcG